MQYQYTLILISPKIKVTVLCTWQTLSLGIQNLSLVLVSGYLKEKKTGRPISRMEITWFQ